MLMVITKSWSCMKSKCLQVDTSQVVSMLWSHVYYRFWDFRRSAFPSEHEVDHCISVWHVIEKGKSISSNVILIRLTPSRSVLIPYKFTSGSFSISPKFQTDWLWFIFTLVSKFAVQYVFSFTFLFNVAMSLRNYVSLCYFFTDSCMVPKSSSWSSSRWLGCNLTFILFLLFFK